MTRVTSIKDIGLVYAAMEHVAPKNNTSTEVVEEKTKKTLATFPLAKDKKIDAKKIMAKGTDKNAFALKNTGPEAAEGFSKNIVDPKNAEKNNHFEPQKFSTALEKKEPANINNIMSKSIFDKLYEDVMKDDALDLGIQAGPEGAEADKPEDMGGEGDEITLTLPRDVAQKLHDMLGDVLGGGEEDHGGEEDLGGETEEKPEDEQAPVAAEEDEQHKAKKDEKEEEKDEDQEEVAGEATQLEQLPDSKGQALQGKNNKVAGKLGHAKGGKASGDIKAVNDGKLSALPDSKGHSLTSKNNKVNATGYKIGDFFK
jgi:hypothetical protein